MSPASLIEKDRTGHAALRWKYSRGVFVSYWFRNDNRLPQGRLAVASYIIVGMIGGLLLGFWKLQVIDADKYSSMAERNRVRYIPVIAPRGRMLDRDGRVLVDNRPAFSDKESAEIPADYHQTRRLAGGY